VSLDKVDVAASEKWGGVWFFLHPELFISIDKINTGVFYTLLLALSIENQESDEKPSRDADIFNYTSAMTELPIIQIDSPPGFIDLGNGNPDLSLLPLKRLQKSAQAFFDQDDPRPLQYGIEQGDGYFRHSLANYLSDVYGDSVHPDSLFVSNGASSALSLICTLFTQRGDTVFVEEPTYFLALRIFADHGVKVVSMPMNRDGLRLDILQDKLSEHQPKFLYTIPSFQNPSGITLSEERRIALVALAQKHEFYIVADEVYHLLGYDRQPPKPFAVHSEKVKQVISLNSFSKILAPGLRLGWVQAHRSVIRRLAGCGLLDSGGGMNPFTAAIVRHMIDSGDLSEHILSLSKEYNRRRDALDIALQQYIPQAAYTCPEGGFFFWARLPGLDTTSLRPRLREFEVDIRPGALFSGLGELKEYIRLGFCHFPVGDIEEGVRRLSCALAC
jgi:2-aminoadipate transaminase